MSSRIYLFGCTVIAALGGFLFGFDTAVISGVESTIQQLYQLNDLWHGFTTASALIGTIVGAVLVSKPADLIGRRQVLIILAVLYLISALGSALAWDWWSFVIFRFIGGLGVGGASVACPMYIAEISPAKLRGRLVAVTQFNIVFGILMAFVSNYIIASLELGAVAWRWMLGVEAIPAAAFFALLFLVPRSPRWLVAKNRDDEAATVLGKLGTDTGDVTSEIREIRESIQHSVRALREPFFQARYIKPIMLAFAIAMFNQLSGINAVLYYAPRVFELSGAADDAAFFNSVAIGLINMVFTVLAMAIIDSFGRKSLMLIGSIGYIVSLGIATAAFAVYGTEFTDAGGLFVFIALMAFIASHAFGQGAVIWVFIGEIFPNTVRARGQAFGSFVHWFMAGVITWLFPYITALSPVYAFGFFCAMMVLQLIWVILVMPETKGVPLEHIHEKLGITRDDEKSTTA